MEDDGFDIRDPAYQFSGLDEGDGAVAMFATVLLFAFFFCLGAGTVGLIWWLS